MQVFWAEIALFSDNACDAVGIKGGLLCDPLQVRGNLEIDGAEALAGPEIIFNAHQNYQAKNTTLCALWPENLVGYGDGPESRPALSNDAATRVDG